MPRPKKTAKQTNMKLPPWLLELAAIVGENRTDGVERLFATLPLFHRVKLYVALQAQEGDKQAESLLHELEALELDRVYKEAVCEGVVVPGTNGEPAAWIV